MQTHEHTSWRFSKIFPNLYLKQEKDQIAWIHSPKNGLNNGNNLGNNSDKNGNNNGNNNDNNNFIRISESTTMTENTDKKEGNSRLSLYDYRAANTPDYAHLL